MVAQALDALQQSCLACAVGADHPEDLTLVDLEADAVDGPDVLVLLDHVLADDRAHFSSVEVVPSTLGPSSWAIRGFAANNLPMASNEMKASPWAGSPRTRSLSPA